MKPKGLITAEEAAELAFNDMPDEFYGSELADRANFYMQRPLAYPATTIRKLRLLKQGGVLNFECINKRDSKYRKLSN